jgi:hypothetical protein
MKEDNMAKTFLNTGVLRRHPVIKKNAPTILQYLDKTSPLSKLFTNVVGKVTGAPGYTPTATRDILEETGDSAAVDPAYILKHFEDAHRQASLKIQGDKDELNKQNELNRAMRDIRAQIMLMAGKSEQENAARLAILTELGSSAREADYRNAISASGSALQAFKNLHPDGVPYKGKLFTPGDWVPFGMLRQDFQANYTYTPGTGNSGSLSVSCEIKDIPDWHVNDFCDEFAAECLLGFGESTIKLDFYDANDYKQPSQNTPGIATRDSEHKRYKNFINTSVIALYQRGLSVEFEKELDPDIQARLNEIKSAREQQKIEGNQYAARAGIGAAGGAPGVIQPLIPGAAPIPRAAPAGLHIGPAAAAAAPPPPRPVAPPPPPPPPPRVGRGAPGERGAPPPPPPPRAAPVPTGDGGSGSASIHGSGGNRPGGRGTGFS